MKMLRSGIFGFIFFSCSLYFNPVANAFYPGSSFSDFVMSRSDETFHDPDYFEIKEDPRLQNVNLLFFIHFQQPIPYPSVPYNRKNQFGTWIQDHFLGSCLNTRGLVLVRDSKTPVSFTANGCTVKSGNWDDPYSNQNLTSASDIQIDHFVPLKNAYMTGAFEWSNLKRCFYANYLGNNFHLLSVSGKENMKKSDSTPSLYLPPNESYVCQYLKQWLEVKLIWSLRLTPKETSAVKLQVDDHHCNPQDFVIPTSFLKQQRDYMTENANLCQSSF